MYLVNLIDFKYILLLSNLGSTSWLKKEKEWRLEKNYRLIFIVIEVATF